MSEICQAANDAAAKILPRHSQCEEDPWFDCPLSPMSPTRHSGVDRICDCNLDARRERVAKIIQTDIIDRMNELHALDIGGISG